MIIKTTVKGKKFSGHTKDEVSSKVLHFISDNQYRFPDALVGLTYEKQRKKVLVDPDKKGYFTSRGFTIQRKLISRSKWTCYCYVFSKHLLQPPGLFLVQHARTFELKQSTGQ